MPTVPNFLLRSIFRANGQLRNVLAPVPRVFDRVEILPFKGGAKAAASISADFELAWAWRGLTREGMEQRAALERENVPRLVAMLSRHRVPITWATVGHLFLTSCKRGLNGCAHEDMPRQEINFGWEGDWYLHDPCADVETASGWYCPDLIRLIQESDVAHEIGTHSFSHIDFGPDRSDSALVRREIEACIGAMRPFGVHPRSLVYCFNHMGHQHLPLLASLGLTAVRNRDPVRLAYPERGEAGVYKIYESMNLRVARHYDYVEKAEVFLREAQQHQAAFHIWFHPSDSWSVFEGVFDPILAAMVAQRDSGELWIATMHDLASYCEARATTELSVSVSDHVTTIDLTTTIETARFGAPEITLSLPVPREPTRIAVTYGGQPPVILDPTAQRHCGKLLQIDVSCRAKRLEVLH